jgi:hypothetical protein
MSIETVRVLRVKALRNAALVAAADELDASKIVIGLPQCMLSRADRYI